MKNNHLITGLLLTTLIPACVAGNTPKMKPHQPPARASCPIIESSDWVAWLNKMPGTDGASLHVSGKIVLPTPGYTIEVKAGPLDRRAPPAQRLRLVVTPPAGMVAQVTTTQEVKAKFPARASDYRAIIIGCGDKTLAEVIEIPAVH